MPWGGFEVVRTLQEGGEANLFEVRRERADGFVQRAVIKQLSGGSTAAPDARDRFAREARLLALIHDPHVVRILDYDVEDGVPYQVLELIDGQDLGAVVALRGPLHPQHVLRVGASIARALLALHTATDADGQPLNLIHNDLAPENVLLGSRGHLKLIDLGRVDDLAARPSSWVHGRRPYLAPERLKGGASTVESDLFALGAILGFLALGHSPFEEPSAQANLLAGRTPRLSERLGASIEKVVLRACHPEPRRRFSSAADFIAACEEEEPRVEAAPESLVKWLRGHRRDDVGSPRLEPRRAGASPSRTEVPRGSSSRRERMRGLFEVEVSVEAGPSPARSTILAPGSVPPAIEATEVAVEPAARAASVADRPGGVVGRWSLLATVGRRGCGELFVAHDRAAASSSGPADGVPSGVRLLKVFEPGSVARTHLEREISVVRRRGPINVLNPIGHGSWADRHFVAFAYLLGRPLGRVVRDLQRSGRRLAPGMLRKVGLDIASAVIALGQARREAAFFDDHLVSPGSIFIPVDGRVLLTDLAVTTATERATLGAAGGRWLSVVEILWRLAASQAQGSELERSLRQLAGATMDEDDRLRCLQDELRRIQDPSQPIDMRVMYDDELRAERAWLSGTIDKLAGSLVGELDRSNQGLETPPEPLLVPAEHPALSTIADESSPLLSDDPTLPVGFDRG